MKYFFGTILFLFFFGGVIAQNSQPPSKKNQSKPKTGAASKTSTKSTAASKKGQVFAKKTSHTSANEPKKGPSKLAPKINKGQTAKLPGKPKPKITTPKPPGENEEYAKAAAVENPEERITALKSFLEKFPASRKKNDALESIAITRIKLAQDRLTTADTESGIALLKTAVNELPSPVPEKLYDDSISRIPTDLFNNGQRVAAIEIASMIEGKIGDNARQLLNVAQFFLMTENGSEAKMLADKAIAVTPTSNAYQTLGLACRLNFQLDDASQAYAKALELEPDSPTILRNLADLKRAQGKPDDALILYHQILDKDATSIPAQTGLILALFDAGKRADAETEMAKSLEQNPNNVILLAGAAYWYAAHNEPDKTIDYSRQAIEKEPRYIWSHIALAHGYLANKQPADAEQVLLKARAFGNFPTLEYEIASARLMSGFYRDAADELRKSFSIKDGMVHTKLGGRVDNEQDGFIEVLSNERRASTFEPEAADDRQTAARLKSLLEFDEIINAKE
ncbi:MAG: tetratricopeptide repeat protein, partial [Candidatus Binatia bacterium]